jgi:hypothetical protein
MYNTDGLVCWRCGHALTEEPLPLARAAACTACGADLHVCRFCEFFDTRVANECREPIAERVVNKLRANFCGYLKPKAGAYTANDASAAAARGGLESLFGLDNGTTAASPTTEDAARSALDALFGKQ